MKGELKEADPEVHFPGSPHWGEQPQGTNSRQHQGPVWVVSEAAWLLSGKFTAHGGSVLRLGSCQGFAVSGGCVGVFGGCAVCVWVCVCRGVGVSGGVWVCD